MWEAVNLFDLGLIFQLQDKKLLFNDRKHFYNK